MTRKRPRWIKWSGAKSPLKKGTLFMYRLRNGGTGAPLATPTCWNWNHAGGDFDIVAYRKATRKDVLAYRRRNS